MAISPAIDLNDLIHPTVMSLQTAYCLALKRAPVMAYNEILKRQAYGKWDKVHGPSCASGPATSTQHDAGTAINKVIIHLSSEQKKLKIECMDWLGDTELFASSQIDPVLSSGILLPEVLNDPDLVENNALVRYLIGCAKRCSMPLKLGNETTCRMFMVPYIANGLQIALWKVLKDSNVLNAVDWDIFAGIFVVQDGNTYIRNTQDDAAVLTNGLFHVVHADKLAEDFPALSRRLHAEEQLLVSGGEAKTPLTCNAAHIAVWILAWRENLRLVGELPDCQCNRDEGKCPFFLLRNYPVLSRSPRLMTAEPGGVESKKGSAPDNLERIIMSSWAKLTDTKAARLKTRARLVEILENDEHLLHFRIGMDHKILDVENRIGKNGSRKSRLEELIHCAMRDLLQVGRTCIETGTHIE